MLRGRFARLPVLDPRIAMADDPIDGTIPPPDAWSVQKSAELYQIGGWGKPYFDINEAGHVCVTPDPRKEAGVDLYELTV